MRRQSSRVVSSLLGLGPKSTAGEAFCGVGGSQPGAPTVAAATGGDRDVIVTCEECSTSFQLDEARIPATGARVRCSRCKHAFFLKKPDGTAADAIHAVVEQVVHGKSARTPAPARDLATPSTRAARDAGPARVEIEEEDWQFSQEIRVPDDETGVAASAPSAPAPRPDSFDLTGDFGRGFDPETFSREDEAAAPPATEGEASDASPAALAGAGLGDVRDFSSLLDDEVSIDLASDGPMPGPPSPPPSTKAAKAAKATKPAGRTAKRAGPERSARAAADDLGDPESWDLVGGAIPSGATRAKAPAAPRGSARVARRENAKAPLDLFAETELPPAIDDAADTASKLRGRLAGVGRVAGWMATAASVTLAFALFAQAEWKRSAPATQRLEIGPLVAETTRMGWLETSRAGLMLVVEGELRNTGRTPAATVPLQLALLDASGRRLEQAPLAVVHAVDEATLREGRPEAIEHARASGLAAWLARPLGPGEMRRFTAFAAADGWPAPARRVLLEAGSDGAR